MNLLSRIRSSVFIGSTSTRQSTTKLIWPALMKLPLLTSKPRPRIERPKIPLERLLSELTRTLLSKITLPLLSVGTLPSRSAVEILLREASDGESK